MDTNQNIHVNTFTGGMNTDQSFDSIKEDQYIKAVNLRVTTNKYKSDVEDKTLSNQKEGVLTPITLSQSILNTTYLLDKNISKFENIKTRILGSNVLKCVSSGNINIILYTTQYDGHKYICIGKINDQELKVLFYIENIKDIKNISVVLHAEQQDVVNLYIATGNDPLLSINIEDEDYIKSLYKTTIEDEKTVTTFQINIDDIKQGGYFPRQKVKIMKKIPGRLKTSQVQYTYRFYKKHGICSKLAPLTNKIHIIDDLRNKEYGNAEDTQTSIGLQLQLIADAEQLTYIKKIFDYVQLYRLSYIKPGQNADVALIFDGKISNGWIVDNENNVVNNWTINDDGIKSIQDLSIEEFSSLSGLTVIPTVIEQNQNYLFAANVKDETIINIDKIGTNYEFSQCSYNDQTGAKDTLSNEYVDMNSESKIDLNTYAFDQKYLESDPNRMRLGGFNDIGTFNFVLAKIPIFNNINNHLIEFSYIHYEVSKNGSPTLMEIKADDIITQDFLNSAQIANDFDIDGGYNNLIVSSLCRSLRRDEVYRYGIIFYDKYGNRSDVIHIGDFKTPSVKEVPLIHIEKDRDGDRVFAQSLGLCFKFHNTDDLLKKNIVGYEIVRCEKADIYTKNIQQVVLSGVIKQMLPDGTKSPAYPTGFITSQPVKLNTPPYSGTLKQEPAIHVKDLYQIFNPNIFIQRNDVLAQIKTNTCHIQPINFLWTGITDTNVVDYNIYQNDDPDVDNEEKSELNKFNKKTLTIIDPYYSISPLYINIDFNSITSNITNCSFGEYLYIDPIRMELCLSKKQSNCFIFNLVNYTNHIYNYLTISGFTLNKSNNRFDLESESYKLSSPTELSLDVSYPIINVEDIKDTTWDSGFSNYKYDGATLKTATKKYKSYITNIGTEQYLNWVCSNKYDIPAGNNDTKSERQYGYGTNNGHYKFAGEFTDTDTTRWVGSRGPIGPGGQCLIIKITGGNKCLFDKMISPVNTLGGEPLQGNINNVYPVGTFLCNITHDASRYSGIEESQMLYDKYYGFGNYFELPKDTKHEIYTKNLVFDGEVYIDMQELYNALKAWDFNDAKNNLQSMQTVYYIPMESTINTRFDYGMNYRNTHNPNMTLESSQITGLSSQDRPLRQYNLIYSDNNTSNNIFNMSSDKENNNIYPQRIFYSNLKTNGEYIDNWQIFKAVNFIDADPKYGEITELYTFKNTLLFWQEYATGKLSVNERSLVKDENSNTIQLGQGDVLQRTDYISTKYGMRKSDMCKVETENGIFWFDYYNKCIATLNDGGAIDYTELKNVKSTIVDYTDTLNYIPQLVYDQKHQEMLFAPIVDETLSALTFNTKYNIPISLYDLYTNGCVLSNIIQMNKNVVCIFYDMLYRRTILQSFYKGDKLPNRTKIQFLVNKDSSTTKVFDNQQVVTEKRTSSKQFFESKKLDIVTDICETQLNSNNIELYNTDREGNIQYAIPRTNNNTNEYGGRVRGKWMLETLTDNNPTEESAISHIITKFRKSYN